MRLSFALISAVALVFFACAGQAPKQETNNSVQNEYKVTEKFSENKPVVSSSSVENRKSDAAESSSSLTKETKVEEVFLADSSNAEDASKVVFDIYTEIPKLANMALARADSFVALGMLDSASAIVEQFSVLNPLWIEWQSQAKLLSQKIQNAYSVKSRELKPLALNLINANTRGASYSEVKVLADSLKSLSPGDSLVNFADSILKISFAKTFEKVRTAKASAMVFAEEKAKFVLAQQKLTELAMRYPEFVDTLDLKGALVKVSSLREELTSSDVEYWKSHDPKKALENAKKMIPTKEWDAAKSSLIRLKASELRGGALRELDTLYAAYCTDKRKLAAAYFAKSKKTGKDELVKAIDALNACLDFAPDYSEKATVISNREFLRKEMEK
ncbi:MAG: hypothetical protein M0P13_01815 [Fibrobacteraceae bacterium]|nr:hypothetical protein [Fibrobacteraceae bacterium]